MSRTGKGEVVYVTSPKGYGKTKVINELVEEAKKQGVDLQVLYDYTTK